MCCEFTANGYRAVNHKMSTTCTIPDLHAVTSVHDEAVDKPPSNSFKISLYSDYISQTVPLRADCPGSAVSWHRQACNWQSMPRVQSTWSTGTGLWLNTRTRIQFSKQTFSWFWS